MISTLSHMPRETFGPLEFLVVPGWRIRRPLLDGLWRDRVKRPALRRCTGTFRLEALRECRGPCANDQDLLCPATGLRHRGLSRVGRARHAGHDQRTGTGPAAALPRGRRDLLSATGGSTPPCDPAPCGRRCSGCRRSAWVPREPISFSNRSRGERGNSGPSSGRQGKNFLRPRDKPRPRRSRATPPRCENPRARRAETSPCSPQTPCPAPSRRCKRIHSGLTPSSAASSNPACGCGLRGTPSRAPRTASKLPAQRNGRSTTL